MYKLGLIGEHTAMLQYIPYGMCSCFGSDM